MIVLAVALSATAREAHAQIEWQVDAAASRLRPAGGVARNALSLAAQGQQAMGMFKPLLSASATLTSDSVAAAQLYIGVRAVPPWSRRMPLDVGAVVAMYGIARGDRGQSRALYVRQHRLSGPGNQSGWWVGGAIAQIDRATAFGSNAVDLGGWFARRRTQYSIGLSTSRTDDRELFRSTALQPDEFANRFRVVDVIFTAEHARTFVDIDVVGGLRAGLEGLSGSRAFAAASLRYRLQQITYVVLSGGSQVADPLRGTPEWRFVAVGFRVGNARPGIARPAGLAGPALRYDRLAGNVRLMIDAPPGAMRVEVMGTMTGWEPRALERSEAGWVIVLPAAPGGHQVQVRVDGGSWLPPAGPTTITDEFGRRVAYIVLL